jgi:hypothetical protein
MIFSRFLFEEWSVNIWNFGRKLYYYVTETDFKTLSKIEQQDAVVLLTSNLCSSDYISKPFFFNITVPELTLSSPQRFY